MEYFAREVVFQEIPGEISLCYSIKGCKLGCDDCSWKQLQDKPGKILTSQKLIHDIRNNYGITCVLFLGGEWDSSLISLLRIVKDFKLLTGLYTGREKQDLSEELKDLTDYLKTGRYIKELGGLDSPITNQRMFFKGKDITQIFRG